MPSIRKTNLHWKPKDQRNSKTFTISNLFGTRLEWIIKRKTLSTHRWVSFWSLTQARSKSWSKFMSKSYRGALIVKTQELLHQVGFLILWIFKFNIWSLNTKIRRKEDLLNLKGRVSTTKLLVELKAKRGLCQKRMRIEFKFSIVINRTIIPLKISLSLI